MYPIIRVSESLYKKLERLAIDFDTPANVIERLVSEALPSDNFMREEKIVSKKISADMIKQSYFQAKEFFFGRSSLTESKEILKGAGMGTASAQDYLLNFRRIMNGEKYVRTMSADATRYFLENIKKDFGDSQLRKALLAVEAHVKYYNGLGHGKLNAIEEVLKIYDK